MLDNDNTALPVPICAGSETDKDLDLLLAVSGVQCGPQCQDRQEACLCTPTVPLTRSCPSEFGTRWHGAGGLGYKVAILYMKLVVDV
ncbi:hypothetical protein UY3_09639 [Chelonia mydas]|uniref:Uncharacterized protein n=1 Tax=Chelonia mydas TaxID=8469 RepID=M7BCA3_CHEMY|nr:hypothetical protein UY3_09639 [Chelonia mydas]